MTNPRKLNLNQILIMEDELNRISEYITENDTSTEAIPYLEVCYKEVVALCRLFGYNVVEANGRKVLEER